MNAIRTVPRLLPVTAVRKVHLTPLRLVLKTASQDGPRRNYRAGAGQKVWLTSHGDISLLDMGPLHLSHAQENDGA